MKIFTAILAGFLLPFLTYGLSLLPSWNRVEEKDLTFFKEHGFDFVVDDSMAHHYKKPTAEFSISIPARFNDNSLTNDFDSVVIISEEISTALGTHDHAGKKRTILTVSEAMAKKSQVIFYFRNNATNVTHGSMYTLEISKVLADWKNKKKSTKGS